ncbi:MAG: hydrolase Nlp/P60 [Chryseobacterium sp. 39-10]|nr:C40 family peptidase [Chryseobacterium sp.]OJV48813.1 MAG: hydrolase Nlp/P60 [Chryseobacterium sp. 39-10]
MKSLCTVSVAPIRAENSHQSEMTTQLLYGESCEILETIGSFAKIKIDFDDYEGWVDLKQIAPISDEDFAQRKTEIVNRLFGVYDLMDGSTLLSIGSELHSETGNLLAKEIGSVASTALQFLNVPYLWSGRSFFGIDCSGFSQLVYKVHGIRLPREAHQQAELGTVLDFLEEAVPGDLAFFENKEGKISHVGIMLEDQKIIHAFGKVRIDVLDSSGIFNKELNQHTHQLRFLKRIG